MRETKIRKAFVCDKVSVALLKASNYVQAAMFRGLLESWKQPIFYDFDRKIDKPLLFKIIVKVIEDVESRRWE